MPVIYAEKAIRPAPQVEISESLQQLGDGRRVGTNLVITLKGTITSEKTDDTYTPLGIEQRLTSILNKQTALREQFSVDGRWLEVQGYDGSPATKIIAIVDNIDFQPGPWVDTCDYTITLSGEAPAGEEDEAEDNHIESASESWQFVEGESAATYRATHTLQAKGKTYYENGGGVVTKKAWEWAKDFVENKFGVNWSTTQAKWSPKSGQQIFQAGLITPAENNLLAYNRVITENVDESDGSYSLTEEFFLSQNPYWEEYTVTVRRDLTDPRVSTVVGINGVIHGLATGLRDKESRLANAQIRWATVKTILLSRVQAYASGVTINPKHISENVDVSINDSTVTYQFEFNDRQVVNHTFEYYNVSMQTSLEDSKTTVTIEGSITGERYADDVFDPSLRYQRAATQWELVKASLFARAKTESGIIDLQPFPVTANFNPNKQDGVITYSFSFDNRIPSSVRHEYTISTRYSREDGKTIVSIDGNITGLRTANADAPFAANSPNERYQNAKNYFNSISGNLVGLISNYVDTTKVNPLPFNKVVSHIPNAGQLNYQQEYNSNPVMCFPNALSENITITDNAAVPIFASIPVPGRAKGPVLQQMGTVREKRRSVTIEVIFPVDYSTTTCSVSNPPNIDVSIYAPAGNPVILEEDQTQWSPKTGTFSRTVSWIYE